MSPRTPAILVTNDDGISSPGIRALAETASQFGKVFLIAPDKPQSGMGHAITVRSGLIVSPFQFGKDITAFSCNGTPADCVKLGIYHLMKHKPALCLSGVNHGSNHSLNVIYSGTMSAALEGALEGIPSAGISFCSGNLNADLTAVKKITSLIINMLLEYKLMRGICLNVNIPELPLNKIKGLKICRQGKGNWKESYKIHKDANGTEHLWLSGKFENQEKNKKDNDLWALKHNYVSIVPTHADMTDYNELNEMIKWKV
jgi:5'-nucleotidase